MNSISLASQVAPRTERQLIQQAVLATLPAWASMIGQHVEVVVHDLMKPEASVIYIANGHVTRRGLGASLLDGPANDTAFLAARSELAIVSNSSHSVVVDYPTLSPQGKQLNSATVVFRDSTGTPFLALSTCLRRLTRNAGWKAFCQRDVETGNLQLASRFN